MKSITIRFIGSGYKNVFQPNIKIYDSHNNLIFNKNSYNGKIKVCLNTNSYYIIKARLGSSSICKWIYINDYNNSYNLIFNHAIINNQKIITFLLTDSNYLNLPISKGKVILWQKQLI